VSGQLDEISSTLGRLMANQEEHMRQQTALFSKFDKVNEELIEHRGAIKLLGTGVAEAQATATAARKSVAAVEVEYAEMKNKGKGFALSLALIGGGGGMAGVAAAIKTFFTGHT